MGKLSRGSIEIKKASLGSTPIKKVSRGSELIWTDEPWPSDASIADDFSSYVEGQRLDQAGAPNWTDRAYGSSGYAFVTNGTVRGVTTDRDTNSAYWNTSVGGVNHWSAIVIAALPTSGSETNKLGAFVRGTTSAGVYGNVTPTSFEIKSGGNDTFSAGTMRASATFAAVGIVPAPGDSFGIMVTQIDTSNSKYDLYLNSERVLTYTGNTGYNTGTFCGIVMSGQNGGAIEEWKAGAF